MIYSKPKQTNINRFRDRGNNMGKQHALSIRLPAALAKKIQRKATNEHRSINATVVHLLDRMLADPTLAEEATPLLDSKSGDSSLHVGQAPSTSSAES